MVGTLDTTAVENRTRAYRSLVENITASSSFSLGFALSTVAVRAAGRQLQPVSRGAVAWARRWLHSAELAFGTGWTDGQTWTDAGRRLQSADLSACSSNAQLNRGVVTIVVSSLVEVELLRSVLTPSRAGTTFEDGSGESVTLCGYQLLDVDVNVAPPPGPSRPAKAAAAAITATVAAVVIPGVAASVGSAAAGAMGGAASSASTNGASGGNGGSGSLEGGLALLYHLQFVALTSKLKVLLAPCLPRQPCGI